MFTHTTFISIVTSESDMPLVTIIGIDSGAAAIAAATGATLTRAVYNLFAAEFPQDPSRRASLQGLAAGDALRIGCGVGLSSQRVRHTTMEEDCARLGCAFRIGGREESTSFPVRGRNKPQGAARPAARIVTRGVTAIVGFRDVRR